MNTPASPIHAKSHSACFHCGQSITGDVVQEKVRERMQVFCCTGCSAATLWINDVGLSDYYDLRTKNAPKASADFID
ncbi:MAG: heavy metal translocating P-type ATPase metal-binding domain-containing protein, partial [Arenimonas sp.]